MSFKYTSKERVGKTDYKIPTFSFRSSLIIMLGAVAGSLIVPLLLSTIGISFDIGVVIGNITVTSYTIAYVRYFIESDEKYCKGFLLTYLGFAVSFGVIAFFWLFLGVYI